MKKSLLILLCFFTFQNIKNVNAQGTLEKGTNVASLGYGLVTLLGSLTTTSTDVTNIKNTTIGPFHLIFEHFVSDKFSLGFSVNSISRTLSYNFDYYNDLGVLVNGTESLKKQNTSVLLRFNYYWVNNDNFSLYSGAGVGYRFGKNTYVSSDPNYNPGDFFSPVFPLGLEAVLGAKYFFTPNIGAFTEVGASKSVIQVGVCAKF